MTLNIKPTLPVITIKEPRSMVDIIQTCKQQQCHKDCWIPHTLPIQPSTRTRVRLCNQIVNFLKTALQYTLTEGHYRFSSSIAAAAVVI